MPDHLLDLDYILNEKASLLKLGSRSAVSRALDNEDLSDTLVYGAAVLIREDEDGMELGCQHEHWQDLQELYL